MIKVKHKKLNRLTIVIITGIVVIAALITLYLVTRPKTPTKQTLSSISVTVKHLDGSPLKDTVLDITNFGYAWNGSTDENGVAAVPPQAIARPIRLCTHSKTQTSSAKCELSASIDETGKALDPSNSLVISLHNNFK